MTIDTGPPPQQYSLDIADAVIFYSPEDEEQVEKFKMNVIDMMKEQSLPVTLYLHDELVNQDTELQSVGKVCDLSVLRFAYITENFCNDKTMMLHKDEQIMTTVMNDTKTFIPVWSKPKKELGKLPYGLAAYAGLHETDRRLSKVLCRLLSSDDHRRKKEHLRQQQQSEKASWLEKETQRVKEQEKIRKEQHEQRMQQIKEEVRQSLAEGSHMPRSEEELVYQHGLLGMKIEPQQQPRSSSRSSSLSADGAIPEYLRWSLERRRNEVQHQRGVVYNITINQPQNVNIGNPAGSGPHADAGDSDEDAVVKNIATDAENPNLNLTESEQPMSTPVQESRSTNESSSFEVVSSPSNV